MPELPETETIAQDLDGQIRGCQITHVEVKRSDVLREVTESELASRTRGATVLRCWRRAKMIIIDLDTEDRLVVQPRFTGALLLDDGRLPEGERRFSTIAFTLSDGRILHYRDVRRLGTVALMRPERFESYSRSLGAEPLDPAMTAGQLSGLLRGSRQAVKKVLMDQRHIAGIGNIYANEALWRSGIDPSRAAASIDEEESVRLFAGIVSVLRESIAARGTSFRDYRDAAGRRGGFADQLAVYGRAGQPCPRCNSRLIGTHAVDGRSTVFCARCQS